MRNQEEFLRKRGKGIGGSEIAAVLGLDKYMTPYGLWERKTGQVPSSPDNRFSKAGHYFESAVADMFADELGVEVWKPDPEHYRHPQFPHLLGTPDRFFEIEGKEAVLEIKTTQYKISDDDILSGPLMKWYFQAQWYAGICGKEICYLAWFEMIGAEFKFLRVDFDPEIFNDIVQQGHNFWTDYVETNQPPPPISKEDILKTIKAVVPKAIEAPAEIMEYQRLMLENKAKIKELSEANEELATAVQLLIMENEVATFAGSPVFTWKEQSLRGFDKSKLKEEHPDIYEKYETVKKIRVLRIKKSSI